MGNLVNAYVLYDGTTSQYVGDQGGVQISINCERLQAFSPRPVWLKRFLAPGDGTVILYEPTFFPTSAELLDPNILTGFWIEQDSKDVMVDVTTIAAFQQACDACCGSVPTIIASNYNGSPTPFTPLAVNQLCIYRLDDGSAGAHDAFADDYVTAYIGVVQLRSNFSNTSHYTVTTYYTSSTFPIIGSDIINNTGVCAN